MKIRTECSNSRSNKWVTALGDGKEKNAIKLILLVLYILAFSKRPQQNIPDSALCYHKRGFWLLENEQKHENENREELGKKGDFCVI